MQLPPPAVFHDKYQWEIWKNTAGKSARFGYDVLLNMLVSNARKNLWRWEQSFSSPHLRQKRMFATWSCWPSDELVLRLQQLCPRSPGEGILQQKEQTRMGILENEFTKTIRCCMFHLLDWKIVWLWAHRYVEPPNIWSGACTSCAWDNQVFCSSASSFIQTMTTSTIMLLANNNFFVIWFSQKIVHLLNWGSSNCWGSSNTWGSSNIWGSSNTWDHRIV